MQPGDFTPAARRPPLFGQGDRELRGVPRVMVVNQPAVGQEWKYVHSGASWFYLRTIVGVFTASAVVATRIPRVTLTYKSLLCGRFAAATGTAANAVVTYTASDATPVNVDPITGMIALPSDLIICDGMTLASSTALIDVGDQWTGIAILGEEFTDKCLELL
jgi:hypothetical protein